MSEDNLPHIGSDEIVMYTTTWCSDCHRARFLLDEYGISYVNVDIEANELARLFVEQVNQGHRVIPTIIFPDGSVLVEPSNQQLADKVGIDL